MCSRCLYAWCLHCPWRHSDLHRLRSLPNLRIELSVLLVYTMGLGNALSSNRLLSKRQLSPHSLLAWRTCRSSIAPTFWSAGPTTIQHLRWPHKIQGDPTCRQACLQTSRFQEELLYVMWLPCKMGAWGSLRLISRADGCTLSWALEGYDEPWKHNTKNDLLIFSISVSRWINICVSRLCCHLLSHSLTFSSLPLQILSHILVHDYDSTTTATTTTTTATTITSTTATAITTT